MKALFVAASLFTLTACGQSSESASTSSAPQTETQEVKTERVDVGPDEFESMMAEAPGMLVDCRTPGEYASGHLEGSTLIDYNGQDFRSEVDKLDKDQTVYIYCRSGGRSGRAASMMSEMGFTKVVNLNGGILAWESDGKEIKR